MCIIFNYAGKHYNNNQNRKVSVMPLNDYIKYLTQQITSYIDTPAKEKKEQKVKNKDESPVYLNRWLGVLPFAFKVAKKKTN
ncbi:MAG TPA: YqzE family protein [Lentibacillus sp.]|nr:YqzE family protein [Lentibacillus sp.]